MFKNPLPLGMGSHSQLKIPHSDWDDDIWQEAKEKGKQGLIDHGKEDPNWVRYMQAVCASQYCLMKNEACRSQEYKRWIELGLPVLPESQMDQLSWEAIEALLKPTEESNHE
jgi:hypothetical protein